MNAVMPGTVHSHQIQPYEDGLAPDEEVSPLPANAHYSNNASNAAYQNFGNSNGEIGNQNSISDDHGDRSNVNNNSEMPIDPNHRRHPSSSTTSTPTEYQQLQHQHQLNQAPATPQQRRHSFGVQMPPANGYGASTPFGLGVPTVAHMVDPFFLESIAQSSPWSIGSTDGSFALVNLRHQEQLLQIQHQQKELQRRRALDVGISSSNSLGDEPKPGSAGIPAGPDGTNSPAGAATSGNGDGNDRMINQTIIQGPPGGAASSQAQSRTAAQAFIVQSAAVIQSGRSLYHDKLFHQSSSSVEGVLAATCDVMGFDIAEMWLRTGQKTHQLTNSHLRPTALQDSVRQDLVEVYYGEKSNERTHRLSPALCKRAKDANDVVWVTAHTPNGAEALRMSISNVRTAVAVPICHESSNTNLTIIYFSIRRIVHRPAAAEFLIHMSLSAAVTSVNALSTDGMIDRLEGNTDPNESNRNQQELSKSTDGRRSKSDVRAYKPTSSMQRADKVSITGARLDLQWRQLLNVEYLTDGGNSWIHTAIFDGKPVVVKTLRPECQDMAVAINEIESEVAIHSRVNHPNIVSLLGAGWTSKKVRFIVLERLDGGTLTQMLGYDTRIRDRRRRFWRKKSLPYLDVLRCARSLACAVQYCQEQAIPGRMILHRDLKPDNIGFTLDGKVKLIDFGLARMLENSDPSSNEVYKMSGETGSLRYMAPEVAEGLPYNHKADVYSFGIILWEMNAGKRPFGGLGRDSFYEQVVYGGSRPLLSKKWPSDLNKLISECWSVDVSTRPTFGKIVDRIDDLLTNEKGGKNGGKTPSKTKKRLNAIIDRHSTWF